MIEGNYFWKVDNRDRDTLVIKNYTINGSNFCWCLRFTNMVIIGWEELRDFGGDYEY
jgi:hypothetical protein